MNFKVFILTLCLFLVACSRPEHNHPRRLTDEELRNKNKDGTIVEQNPSATTLGLHDRILYVGKRALDYYEFLKLNNLDYDADAKKASKFEELQPAPGVMTPENPNFYSYENIEASFLDFEAKVPKEIKQNLFNNNAFFLVNGYVAQDYKVWIQSAIKSYDRLIRIKTNETYLDYYSNEAPKSDIRGFHFFSKISAPQDYIKSYDSLTSEQKNALESALWSLCFNNEKTTADNCTDALKTKTPENFLAVYSQYLADGDMANRRLYELFPEFLKEDATWDASSDTLILPMLEVAGELGQIIVSQLESVWSFGGIHLKLDVVKQKKDDNTFFIEFIPGSQIFVNELGGNQITMDGNDLLSTLDSQWVISHEFGHVIGFNDCYVEFYDIKQKGFVYYMMDGTNIMCARGGLVQDKHKAELIKHYKK